MKHSFPVDTDGVVSAYRLDGRGGGAALEDCTHADLNPEKGGQIVWLHLDRNAGDKCEEACRCIGLDPVLTDALLAHETGPRAVTAPGGLLIILRGVNTNPGAEPEDMVGLRMWLDEKRIISVRYRPLASVRDISERLEQGIGPTGPGDFLATIADRLVERMGPVIHGLRDELDALEDGLEGMEREASRTQLRTIRRQAAMLRRYLAPQRDVVARLPTETLPWLRKADRERLREAAATTARYVAELDSLRERAAIVQDEIITLGAEEINRSMFALTLTATIVLPLAFVTGLFGMNVGGVPLSETKNGFWWVTGSLGAMAVVMVLALYRLKGRR